MENKNYDLKLDELIRGSMDITDKPSLELNNSLKAGLYQREAILHRQTPTRAISLWYLPMILNFATFGLLAVMALLVIANPYLSKFVAGICIYMGLAGILITVLGVKRATIKDEITVRIQKRGVIA